MVRRWSALAVCLSALLLGAADAARSADNLVFVPLPPCRVIDTRVAGAGGPLVAGTPRTFFFRGPTRDYATTPNQGGSATGCGIADLSSDGAGSRNLAQAVAINIVAVGPAGAGDLRAWPANQSVPTASVINYAAVPGLNMANGVIVPMCDEVSGTPCAGGDITFRADVSATNLVVDVVGYFHAGSTQLTLSNTALGHAALAANTTGTFNSASGASALAANTTGFSNTANGAHALGSNTTGSASTAIGGFALSDNSLGRWNTAIGAYAANYNTIGNTNTAVGTFALRSNTTGTGNLAIGGYAGQNLTTGNDNIDIANHGVAGESGVIRIGTSPTQTKAFLAGVRGVTTANNDAVAVLVDSAGQLGTVSSSIRFKEDVHDLGSAAERVLDLRPVSFRYKKPFANGEKPVQYGLIAEEVAKVLPELVAYGQDGQPETVKYQVLPTLLLAELEKEHARLGEQDEKLRERDEKVAALLARVEALEAQIAALSARAVPEGLAPPR